MTDYEKKRAVSREGKWKAFATFVIEFQYREGDAENSRKAVVDCRTYTHHMEDDETAVWRGINGDRLCKWLLDRVDRNDS